MKTLADTMEMGGYAAYVWPAFGAAAIIIAAMAIISFRSLRRAQQTLRQLDNET